MSDAIKDPALHGVLASLELDRRGWILVDHWEADLTAIGVAHEDAPRHLAYLTTWRCRPGRVTVIIETPTGPDPTDYEEREVGEDIDVGHALAAIEAHIDRRSAP